MTTGKSLKKLVRDIQLRTDWSYSFAHRLVTVLGYERVSVAIDESRDLKRTGDILNAQANGEPA